ncbi:MAG: hypothetical protein JW768_08720 [Chitinispirillaceae bacterium]|nr:hypothetical protein [Chitinispirillaceae bacterium]
MKTKTKKKAKRTVSRFVADAVSPDTPLTAFLSLFMGEDEDDCCGTCTTAVTQKPPRKVS